ncbi:MAG: hypothetical protein WC217_01560 [Candidatus Paceibacterota bacterium]|jgi:hypothetical protein
MNTAYKPRVAAVASPYQIMKKEMLNVHSDEHPVQKEIRRIVGTYPLTIEVTEDIQTLATLKHIPGLIAFIASVKKDGQIIGQGRGSSIISRMNKFIERTVRMSFNGAIIAAVMHATKALDVLADPLGDMSIEPVDARQESYAPEGITDKQKSYLFELIRTKVTDEEQRRSWEAQLDELTKDEASQAIQSFKS